MSTEQKRARIGLLAFICLLHAAALLGWRAMPTVKRQDAGQRLHLWFITPPSEPQVRSALTPPHATSKATTHVRTRTKQIPDTPNPSALTQNNVPSTTETPDHTPAPTSVAPLNVNQLLNMARENEKNRIKSPLERLHEEEVIDRTVEAKVADAAKRGARQDCQTAYAAGGLLAIIPLVYDTVTDKGCKWK